MTDYDLSDLSQRSILIKNKFRCPRDARLRSNVFAAEELVHVLSTSVHGLEMPVGECPYIARGACPLLCPWSARCFVYRTCTTELYCNVGT